MSARRGFSLAERGFSSARRGFSPARRGFSLVEMVIVLVLAGIVSTAAISMFSTQNRLNAAMTALGESQENARSAVQLAASELRAAAGGAIVKADADRLVVRVPVVVGVVCGEGPGSSSVDFPLDGRSLDLQDDVDGKAFLGNGSTPWVVRNVGGNDAFRGELSRQPCIDAGNGSAGSNSDYATMAGRDPIGARVLLFREVTYYFATSALDSDRRGFFRSEDKTPIELAQGFSDATRFEYRVDGDTAWVTSARGRDLDRIEAVRLLAEVVAEGTSGTASGTATFSLTREIQLRNVQ